MKWIAAELHTHTLHSDGAFSVWELLASACNEGLDVLAITDHNTRAPLYELAHPPEADVLPVIRGIEWTTFFGHLCVLGEHVSVDWRDATCENIAAKLAQIHGQGGLCGIAHPFALGSPMCTGCYWDYNLRDYANVDYMEIWSEGSPARQVASERAKALWIRVLDAGYRVAAAYGRDWHARETDGEIRAITCLRVADGAPSAQTAFEAIAAGRTAVTLGPLLELLTPGGEGPGDCLPTCPKTVRVRADASYRRKWWERFDIVPHEISLLGEGGRVLATVAAEQTETAIALAGQAPPYLRAELWGTLSGERCCLALTSPMYIASGDTTVLHRTRPVRCE